MLFSYDNKKTFLNFSSSHVRHIEVSNFDSGGIQYHTRLETGDSIAVMSIQNCYFSGFSIPQLFHSEHSAFPFIISSTQFPSFVHKKQLRLRETAKLMILY